MVDKIILICVAIFLPLGLVIANKLIDRTTIKEKDRTIADLKDMIGEAVFNKVKAEKSQAVSEAVSSVVSDNATGRVDNANKASDLMADAKSVDSIDDALDVARRQVEVNR